MAAEWWYLFEIWKLHICSLFWTVMRIVLILIYTIKNKPLSLIIVNILQYISIYSTEMREWFFVIFVMLLVWNHIHFVPLKQFVLTILFCVSHFLFNSWQKPGGDFLERQSNYWIMRSVVLSSPPTPPGYPTQSSGSFVNPDLQLMCFGNQGKLLAIKISRCYTGS